VTVFSTPPGNAFTLTVALRDQNNVAYTGATSKSFSSGNPLVATVSGDGTITGVAVGSAQVTVTVQAGSVSRTATTIVTVQEPAAEASVETHEVRFEPLAVHIRPGGKVTWLIGRPGILISHNVTFTTSGAPTNIPTTLGGDLISRVFPTPGSFAYQCTLHTGMTGTVHVH
jgi:plastocyanin